MKYFFFSFSGHYLSGSGTVGAENQEDALVKAKIEVGQAGFDKESVSLQEIGADAEIHFNGDY